MTKKRHNIDTIAEVLIDKLNAMERTAQRIENASSKEMKIDTAEMKALIENQRSAEESILSDLRAVQKKNSTRVPNWLIAVMVAFYLASLGFMLYAWNKAETYDEAIQRANFFEQEYQKLKK